MRMPSRDCLFPLPPLARSTSKKSSWAVLDAAEKMPFGPLSLQMMMDLAAQRRISVRPGKEGRGGRQDQAVGKCRRRERETKGKDGKAGSNGGDGERKTA